MPLVRGVRAAAAVTALGVSMLTPVAGPPPAAKASSCGDGPVLRYVVLFEQRTGETTAEREIEGQCGSLTSYFDAIGVGVAESSDPAFAERVGPDRAYSAEAELRQQGATGYQALTAGPQDPSREQWNMVAIGAPRARAITPGSRDVVVGVLDSGIDAKNPELTSAVDPGLSADCLSGSPESPGRPWAPGESGHGTHVAGIIAAADDGAGVTGVAPNVRLASIRVVDRAGYVHPEYAVCGFMWAAEQGIRVANSSFLVESAQQGCGAAAGSPVPKEAVRRAVDYATSRGVLTVAALGNERIDLSARQDRTRPHCDAVPVDLDDVVAVSAVGKDQVKSGYSSYGLGAVDLAAPGGESRQDTEECVLSTVPGGYGTACGTSMAAPHVSGVAALAASQHPDAEPRALARMLTDHSRPMSCPSDYDLNADSAQDALCHGYASYNGFYGHGMVDAARVVEGELPDTRRANQRRGADSALGEGGIADR